MTSTERSVMRLASSWMVITSGMITSRMTLSRGCTTPAWRSFSRSRRRLQRGQRALALRLVEGVVDGELDALAPLVAGLDGALGRLGALLLGARFLLRLGLDLESARRRAWRSARRAAAPRRPWLSRPRAPLGSTAGAFAGTLRLDRLGLRRGAQEAAGSSLLDLGLRLRLGRSASRRARSSASASARSLRGLERAPARVELVGGEAAGPLHHLGEQPLRLLRARRLRLRRRRARRSCASSSSRRPPTSSGRG